jgi:hypothetical protein
MKGNIRARDGYVFILGNGCINACNKLAQWAGRRKPNTVYGLLSRGWDAQIQQH